MQEYNEHTIRNVIQKLIQGELIHDEEILWTGRPDPSVIFSKADCFLVPFTVVLTVAIVALFLYVENNFHTGVSTTTDTPTFFYIPFMISVLYLAFGRFIYKNWKKKHTFYAITNKRAFILHDNNNGKTKELKIETLQTMSKVINSDGHGNIYFGENPGMYVWFDNTGLEILDKNRDRYISMFVFYDIRNAAAVYGLVTRLVQEGNQTTLR